MQNAANPNMKLPATCDEWKLQAIIIYVATGEALKKEAAADLCHLRDVWKASTQDQNIRFGSVNPAKPALTVVCLLCIQIKTTSIVHHRLSPDSIFSKSKSTEVNISCFITCKEGILHEVGISKLYIHK